MASQFAEMTSLSKFFDVSLFLLSNVVSGPRFMSISFLVLELQFFYKKIDHKYRDGNTPVWILPNIWRLGLVRSTRISMNVSYKMLQNAAKCQGYSFYRFWVISGKPTWGQIKLSPTHPISNFFSSKWHK